MKNTEAKQVEIVGSAGRGDWRAWMWVGQLGLLDRVVREAISTATCSEHQPQAISQRKDTCDVCRSMIWANSHPSCPPIH